MAKSDGLSVLAKRLQDLRQQAQGLGIFTNDRELLECSICGLKENVTFAGTLFTCREDAIEVDIGLRFPEPDEEGYSRCPGCGEVVRLDEDDYEESLEEGK